MPDFSMMGYIREQQFRLKNTLHDYEVFTDAFINVMRTYPIKRIILLGSGTSYHVSLMAKKYFEKYLPLEVSVHIPTVFTNYEKINNSNVFQKEEILVMAISQSGTSFSTTNALKKAHDEHYMTIVLSEDTNSMICEYADIVLRMLCGVEEVPAETKGYTTALLSMYLLAVRSAYELGYLSENDWYQKQDEIEKTIHYIPYVIDESCEWFVRNQNELLSMWKGDIAGYGFNHVTALEACLKLSETTRKKVSGFELEELLHGSEMGYEESSYLFLIGSDEKEYARMLETRDFLSSITKHIFIITNKEVEDHVHNLKLDIMTSDELSPILFVIPFQVYAALACKKLGIDTNVYPFGLEEGLGHELVQEDKK